MTIQEHLRSYRVRHSLKVGLGCVICMLVSALFHLEAPYFAVISVHIMMTAHRDNTFEQGIERWVGRSLGAVVGLIAVYLFHDMEPLYIFAFFFLICLCTYLYAEGKFTYASLMAAVAVGGVMFYGLVSITVAEDLTADIIVQIAIGVLVVWLIDYTLWPPKTRGTINENLSKVYSGFADAVRDIVLISSGVKPRADIRTRISHDELNAISGLILRAEREEREGLFPSGLYVKLAARTKSLFVRLEALGEITKEGGPYMAHERLSQAIFGVFSGLVDLFGEASDSVFKEKDISVNEQELREKIDDLENTFAAVRAEGVFQTWNYSDVLRLGSLVSLLSDIGDDAVQIVSLWRFIQGGGTSPAVVPGEAKSGAGAGARPGSFKLSPRSLKAGLKTGVTVMIIVAMFLFFHIAPGMAFSAIITSLVISYQANLGLSHLKAKLRLFGCLFGGLYGLLGLYVLSQSPHMLVLVMILFLGMFLSTYVALGSERISYAGIQSGMVLPLALLISNGPPASMSMAFDRFLGIILGGVVVLAVLHFIWPQHPVRMLREKLSSALSDSGKILRLILGRRPGDLAELDSRIAAFESNLPTTASLHKDAGYILFGGYRNAECYLAIIDSLESVYAALDSLKRALYGGGDRSLMDSYLEHMGGRYERIVDVFEEVSIDLSGRPTGSVLEAVELADDVHRARDEFRAKKLTFAYGSHDLEKFSTLVTSIDSILLSLEAISEAVKTIDGEDYGGEGYKLANV